MKQFLTSTVEQRKIFDSDFNTHPMEVAWASEAIFFIHVEEIPVDSLELKASVQISVDGVNWVDEGTRFDTISSTGHYFVKVSHFGGWLRLNCKLSVDSKAKITIHLVVKE
jgi:hypothetical protein